ncbi:MAG: glycosyltransferase family 9 protein [bacterium]|nr:glycosyltransferase family 9 protein [bacterium]
MSERYLIIRLGALGDIVHTLPLAAAIRDAKPDAQIFWAADPAAAGAVLEGNPDLDEVIPVETRRWRRNIFSDGFSGVFAALSHLRRCAPDVAVDAQGLIKSGIIALASGARKRVGFAHEACREGMNVVFTTHWADPPPRPHHVVEKNLSLLAPLGIPHPALERLRFPLPETAQEAAFAENFMRGAGCGDGAPLLVVHPAAGWVTKQWAPGRYAALGDAWREMTRGRVLITWGPGEEHLAKVVGDAMKETPLLAPPTSVRELAALIRRVSVFAGGDTGPLHLAAALGIRCLALIGPTDPVRNGPWGEGHAVLHENLSCSRCYGRKCPDIECLDRLAVPRAVAALARLWENRARS